MTRGRAWPFRCSPGARDCAISEVPPTRAQRAPDSRYTAAADIRPSVPVDVGKPQGGVIHGLVPATGIRELALRQEHASETASCGQRAHNSRDSPPANIALTVSVDVREHQSARVLVVIPPGGIAESGSPHRCQSERPVPVIERAPDSRYTAAADIRPSVPVDVGKP